MCRKVVYLILFVMVLAALTGGVEVNLVKSQSD